MFSTIWGICFSLNANPNVPSGLGFDTVLAQSDLKCRGFMAERKDRTEDKLTKRPLLPGRPFIASHPVCREEGLNRNRPTSPSMPPSGVTSGNTITTGRTGDRGIALPARLSWAFKVTQKRSPCRSRLAGALSETRTSSVRIQADGFKNAARRRKREPGGVRKTGGETRGGLA